MSLWEPQFPRGSPHLPVSTGVRPPPTLAAAAKHPRKAPAGPFPPRSRSITSPCAPPRLRLSRLGKSSG